MADVDDLEHAQDEGEADGDEGVDAAQFDAVDQLLAEQGQAFEPELLIVKA